MALAHEDDVVFAFRQTLQEELRRVQDGGDSEPLFIEGAPADENLRRLVKSHEHLQCEVALLRTVILKLVSQPVDSSPAN